MLTYAWLADPNGHSQATGQPNHRQQEEVGCCLHASAMLVVGSD
jgi:hypothetical protein